MWFITYFLPTTAAEYHSLGHALSHGVCWVPIQKEPLMEEIYFPPGTVEPWHWLWLHSKLRSGSKGWGKSHWLTVEGLHCSSTYYVRDEGSFSLLYLSLEISLVTCSAPPSSAIQMLMSASGQQLQPEQVKRPQATSIVQTETGWVYTHWLCTL